MSQVSNLKKAVEARIDVKRIGWALGAEVRGVDISKPLSEEQIRAIRDALLEHKVLLFRDCPMTPEEQIRFTKFFGPLPEMPFNKRWMHPEFTNEVYFITNKPRADGSLPETTNTGRVWHFDQNFMPEPAMGRVLHCVEAPEIGGTTMFANQELAYEMLTPAFKRIVDGLRVVYDIVNSDNSRMPNRKPLTEEERKAVPTGYHPCVRTHPETGRRTLFFNKTNLQHFEGMTREESAGIIEFLHQHTTQPTVTFRHSWRPGDTLFWDNRCATHYAPPDYDTGDLTNPKNWRTMHGTTIAGDKPVLLPQAVQ